MSLINEALKKAQKERAQQQGRDRRSLLQESSVSQADGKRPGSAAPAFPLVKLLLGLVIAGSTLASAIAFILFLFFQMRTAPDTSIAENNPPATQEQVTSPTPAPTTPPTDISPLPESNAIPQSLPDNEVSGNLDTAPELTADPVPKTDTLVDTPDLDSPSSDLIPAPDSTPTTESSPLDTGPTDPESTESDKSVDPETVTVDQKELSSDELSRVEEYIRNSDVTGIRLSGPDSKVVLNNRVYRLGELVLDLDLHLKIVGIQKKIITFEDKYGTRYTKRF